MVLDDLGDRLHIDIWVTMASGPSSLATGRWTAASSTPCAEDRGHGHLRGEDRVPSPGHRASSDNPPQPATGPHPTLTGYGLPPHPRAARTLRRICRRPRGSRFRQQHGRGAAARGPSSAAAGGRGDAGRVRGSTAASYGQEWDGAEAPLPPGRRIKPSPASQAHAQPASTGPEVLAASLSADAPLATASPAMASQVSRATPARAPGAPAARPRRAARRRMATERLFADPQPAGTGRLLAVGEDIEGARPGAAEHGFEVFHSAGRARHGSRSSRPRNPRLYLFGVLAAQAVRRSLTRPPPALVHDRPAEARSAHHPFRHRNHPSDYLSQPWAEPGITGLTAGMRLRRSPQNGGRRMSSPCEPEPMRMGSTRGA